MRPSLTPQQAPQDIAIRVGPFARRTHQLSRAQTALSILKTIQTLDTKLTSVIGGRSVRAALRCALAPLDHSSPGIDPP